MEHRGWERFPDDHLLIPHEPIAPSVFINDILANEFTQRGIEVLRVNATVEDGYRRSDQYPFLTEGIPYGWLAIGWANW